MVNGEEEVDAGVDEDGPAPNGVEADVEGAGVGDEAVLAAGGKGEFAPGVGAEEEEEVELEEAAWPEVAALLAAPFSLDFFLGKFFWERTVTLSKFGAESPR